MEDGVVAYLAGAPDWLLQQLLPGVQQRDIGRRALQGRDPAQGLAQQLDLPLARVVHPVHHAGDREGRRGSRAQQGLRGFL
eukprot:scaffold189823_cov32-Prasinocladus_malaysianus.AAC.1